MKAFHLRFLMQDGHARLEVWRLHVDNQTPLEPAAQTLLDIRHFTRRTVARQDDLLAVAIQFIERMEELVLRAFLAE